MSTALPPFNIVLVEPLIPQNTGTIGRLAAATNSLLHLVKPLGFELSDKYLKRAGLDYWTEIKLTVHESWDSFMSDTKCSPERLWMLTKHADHSYSQVTYQPGDFLIFGNETIGLRGELHAKYRERRLRIPMENEKVRSLNLSNAVSIVLYEARRQCGVGV